MLSILVGQALRDYKDGKTTVFLPSGYVYHTCVDTLISIGCITPISFDWHWSTGYIDFAMTPRQFRKLKLVSWFMRT